MGALFGTTFYLYVKWAARGFADPAAYIFFIGGLVVLVGRYGRPDARFAPAFGAGLLFALALFMKPVIALAAAVLLGGAGLAALWQRQYARLAGLCLGFLPVLGMGLHNFVYGGVLVPFSANAGHPDVFVTPPSVYLAAVGEVLRFDLAGEHVLRVIKQLADWLTGPTESHWLVPVHLLAVAIVVRVAVWSRGSDPWLRLIAWAALAQHAIGLTHVPTARYYYLVWFLTLLVIAVWARDEGIAWLRARYPGFTLRAANHPATLAFARALDRLAPRPGVSAAE
jgi:hypothetical protein